MSGRWTATVTDVRQESHQHIFDVKAASLSEGRIVYACGSDLWLLDLNTGHEEIIPITLVSDFDQMREHWVAKPLDFLTSVHIAPDGSSAVFTARGEVFTLPAKTGRIVKVAGDSATRYREATFLPDGKSIVALSTESGETEFWKFAANGEGAPEQWTHDAKVLRWDGVPSPDGRWLAHHDKDEQLWIYDTKSKQDKLILKSMVGGIDDLRWSPDSRWLAFAMSANNQYEQIKVLNVESGEVKTLTSDRYNSSNPLWTQRRQVALLPFRPQFENHRQLAVGIAAARAPLRSRGKDLRACPYHRPSFAISARRTNFIPTLQTRKTMTKRMTTRKMTTRARTLARLATNRRTPQNPMPAKTKKDEDKDKKKPADVKIDFTDMETRLSEVPAPAGNYDSLQAAEKRLCWLNATDGERDKRALQCFDIANKGDEVETVVSDVKSFEISLDRKKMLVRKGDDFFVFDSSVKPTALADPKALKKAAIDLSHWKIATTPRDEFHGIFLDAWRLERDYFYDRKMQGVDWNAMRDRYMPLVDRVANRDELNEVIAQMVRELSALHIFVLGGDAREPSDKVELATLGATLRRDEKAGGFVVQHIYLHDPDLPSQAPPLARPESLVKEGEVILSIDGQSALSVTDERELLQGKAGQQVLLRVKPVSGDPRDVLVKPISDKDDAHMRYAEWEYSRRLQVEASSKNQIGYVHLQAMGPEDIDQWARDFYPVFDRQGLIIDVRHNRGGNIDSWLLSDLLRKAWFYWQPRVGNPIWNMQYAFRGHIVVLCDQDTASDGEAFSEGFKYFKMGTVIGTRTWGGEIWLSANNTQADNGIATAAETGVYSADGRWLIEGHGVDPDITVDNLPHATFEGTDAQLKAAIDLLQKQIAEDPRPVPQHPPYPDKSFKYQQ